MRSRWSAPMRRPPTRGRPRAPTRRAPSSPCRRSAAPARRRCRRPSAGAAGRVMAAARSSRAAMIAWTRSSRAGSGARRGPPEPESASSSRRRALLAWLTSRVIAWSRLVRPLSDRGRPRTRRRAGRRRRRSRRSRWIADASRETPGPFGTPGGGGERGRERRALVRPAVVREQQEGADRADRDGDPPAQLVVGQVGRGAVDGDGHDEDEQHGGRAEGDRAPQEVQRTTARTRPRP